MTALRSLLMEDCPLLTARAIAGLTGLTVRRRLLQFEDIEVL